MLRSAPARRLLGGLLVPLAVLLVAGCAPDNTPKEYNSDVQHSFEAFCTGGITPVDGVTTTIASSTYCQCAYAVFRDNVPYNDDDRSKRFASSYPEGAPTFQTLNNDLKDDPGKFDQLPDNVKQKLRECPKAPAENVTGGTTPGGGSTGTTPTPVGSTPGSAPA